MTDPIPWRKGVWLNRGWLAAGPFLGINLIAAGGGHGTFIVMKLTAPWWVLLASAAQHLGERPPWELTLYGFATLLLQMPVYGCILDLFRGSRTGWLVIGIAHVVGICFALSSEFGR